MKAKKDSEKPKPAPAKRTAAIPIQTAFDEVVSLIEQARKRAFQSANTHLIDLYWRVGEYVSFKIETDGWGQGTFKELSAHIQLRQPGIRGFSPQNIWRMRQFFETYRNESKLSTLLRELPWSSHLHILTRAKRQEEREFYLRMAAKHHWDVREVARQLDGSLFERAVLDPPKVSKVLRELDKRSGDHFKDVYLLEFLDLPDNHSERDLHQALLANLGRFLAELGRDFCFVGSEYPLQVGGRDFALNLLFFHHGLNCLVAVKLKMGRFEPEYLGKLEFYLEALDRDHRKPHENPSLGVLLCASKDSEVVEYALSRSLSPALIAEYQSQLPDKKLLAAKLHEFYVWKHRWKMKLNRLREEKKRAVGDCRIKAIPRLSAFRSNLVW
jgi:predicted nuclease of restriction endonuclease-like (RecB) superfamily